MSGVTQSAQSWKSRLTHHVPPGQCLRYLLVGGWNTLFGYTAFAGCVALFAFLMPRFTYSYLLASVVSSLVSITVAYFGYKFMVFKTRGNYLAEWLKCLVVYGTGIVPGLVLLPLLVHALRYVLHLDRGAPYLAGALIAVFSALYNFLGHKNFSFRPRERDADGPAAPGV